MSSLCLISLNNSIQRSAMQEVINQGELGEYTALLDVSSKSLPFTVPDTLKYEYIDAEAMTEMDCIEVEGEVVDEQLLKALSSEEATVMAMLDKRFPKKRRYNAGYSTSWKSSFKIG